MNAIQQLRSLGQSVWLDQITRDLLDSGGLRQVHPRVRAVRAHLEPDHFRWRHRRRECL